MELVKTNYQLKLIKSFVVVVLGSVALTISAKLKIPFYPVPMTMQTFVVLFLGIAFGYKIGIATISLYLIEGIAGFPVFSNSPEKGVGLIYFIGPTMGYLVGFLVACFLTTFINLKDNFLIIFLKLMMSISAVYILGILWLGALIGWDKPIIQWGVTPFLLAEFFKISLLTLLTKKIIKFRKFI
tara:strand:+ start:283 stop:834 length:552 start_codon:yes stop_codon:yes gene_type:complete